MYKVGRRDKVVPLDSLPQGDPGALLPLVVASDNELRIAYISAGDRADGEVMVTVTFNVAEAHMLHRGMGGTSPLTSCVLRMSA